MFQVHSSNAGDTLFCLINSNLARFCTYMAAEYNNKSPLQIQVIYSLVIQNIY